MTAPQIRVGQATLQDAQPTGQLRIGDVRLVGSSGPQLRIGTVQLTKPTPPQLHYADIAATQNAPVSVTVTVSATDPMAAGPMLCLIDWGDGSAPASAQLTTDPQTVAGHVYASPGTYPVTVTVTAQSGLSATLSSSVLALAPAQRRIFAVKTPAGARPVLFKGVVRGGQLQPLLFAGVLESGAPVDPNAVWP